ncbi:PREDICTED: uncharacterized protein LOC105583531 [Cercocebus atys]|uniref:uncharacterized protein LOC105583531 n=1 Tax=Cercocebus atys TaxID=9531 RepID=UPI0005F3BEAB|nr:PREDICTED: uncharacterized protein LOC105583531 [Cercocebus atys]
MGAALDTGTHERARPCPGSKAPSSRAWIGLGQCWGTPQKAPNLLLTPLRRRSPAGLPFSLGSRGGEAPPPQPPRFTAYQRKGGGVGVLAASPPAPRLPSWRGQLLGFAARRQARRAGWLPLEQERSVFGCPEVRAPLSRLRLPELSGAADLTCRGPEQTPPSGLGRLRSGDRDAPQRFLKDQSGAGGWPGEGGTGGPVGHPDSGLDLVGWLLWQPGGSGKREGTRGAGTPSAVARGGGWLGLTQTGPLLQPGWEQLHGRKRADTAPTNIRLVPSRSSTSARVSLSLGDGDPVILPTERGFPANRCDSSSGEREKKEKEFRGVS